MFWFIIVKSLSDVIMGVDDKSDQIIFKVLHDVWNVLWKKEKSKKLLVELIVRVLLQLCPELNCLKFANNLYLYSMVLQNNIGHDSMYVKTEYGIIYTISIQFVISNRFTLHDFIWSIHVFMYPSRFSIAKARTIQTKLMKTKLWYFDSNLLVTHLTISFH